MTAPLLVKLLRRVADESGTVVYLEPGEAVAST